MTEIEKASERNRTDSETSNDVDPHFEPVVELPLVEVLTNEEEEEVLLTLRAKLYRFITNEGPEWKERGTGEMKLLRHKENNSCRIVMRRDKTLKVCANHFITPWMELKPSFGSEKAFVYTVPADFADEIPRSECLAIRFGSVELANMFKDKFKDAQEIVKTKCCLYNGEHEESSSESEEDEDKENESEKNDNEGDKEKEEKGQELCEKISELKLKENTNTE